MRVGGIFKPNSLVGSYVVSDAYFIAHFDDPLPIVALVAARPRSGNLLPALKHTLRAYPSLKIRTRAQFEQDEQNNVNSLLDLVYVLLALAVLVALIGIVNTLMLSVFERTREIGLLRAVGMTRRQVISMISSESIVIALFGAVVGIVVGSLLGAALAGSLRDNGVTVVSVPIARLVAFLVIAGVMGLLASIWPSVRASKLDVLGAIATE
jgi:putative ABC transport system permease protein